MRTCEPAVSRNMLVCWLMGFGHRFWDCLERYAHFRFLRGSDIFVFCCFFAGLSRGICSCFGLWLERYAHFRCLRGSDIFVFCCFFFFCGTVSRNMLMLWPMGCGILPSFFQLSREICSCQMSETFRNICFLFFLGMSLMFWHMRFGVLGFIGLSRGIW